jgi:alkanesulfonate monooxygenase SsuD/methylene tetrahydromethanopterin reductase-like flavin-dependent oxidoreductase (luciferase family)
MKFGVFFQVQVPRPWRPESEFVAFHNALEQARLADELGFDHVWATEHHFLEEYSHSSAPEVLLAAIAAQTTQIRIGHGVIVCVPEINHPIRLAERAAVLDLISGGRLEFGTGRSGTWTELAGFGADPAETKRTWDEFVRIIPQMWMQERFSYDGIVTIPERSILPKPMQKPHPPMWVAVTAPGTELDAGDYGMGCLWLGATSLKEQETRVAAYRKRLEQCDPVGAVNNRSLAQNYLYCHEDAAVATDRGLAMVDGFAALNRRLLFNREVYPSSSYKLRANFSVSASAPKADRPDGQSPLAEGLCIGTPDHIIQELKSWESTGLDGVNFLINGADVLPQEQVLESMRLFAAEVMPAFR